MLIAVFGPTTSGTTLLDSPRIRRHAGECTNTGGANG